MKILGIDFGQVRIGISISDPFGWIAQMLKTIKYDTSIPYNEILQIIKKNNVNKIIVGYPKNMNGTLGDSAIKTDKFIDSLKDFILNNESGSIEIIKWDERLTTVAANRLMTETRTKTKNKKNKVDMMAAQYMLQGYLDFMSKEN